MQTSTPVHDLAAERHAELVDRPCEVPDGPDRRESIAKLLVQLDGIPPPSHRVRPTMQLTCSPKPMYLLKQNG